MMSQYDDKNKQVKAYHKQWLIWAMALVGGNALAADYEVNVGSNTQLPAVSVTKISSTDLTYQIVTRDYKPYNTNSFPSDLKLVRPDPANNSLSHTLPAGSASVILMRDPTHSNAQLCVGPGEGASNCAGISVGTSGAFRHVQAGENVYSGAPAVAAPFQGTVVTLKSNGVLDPAGPRVLIPDGNYRVMIAKHWKPIACAEYSVAQLASNLRQTQPVGWGVGAQGNAAWYVTECYGNAGCSHFPRQSFPEGEAATQYWFMQGIPNSLLTVGNILSGQYAHPAFYPSTTTSFQIDHTCPSILNGQKTMGKQSSKVSATGVGKVGPNKVGALASAKDYKAPELMDIKGRPTIIVGPNVKPGVYEMPGFQIVDEITGWRVNIAPAGRVIVKPKPRTCQVQNHVSTITGTGHLGDDAIPFIGPNNLNISCDVVPEAEKDEYRPKVYANATWAARPGNAYLGPDLRITAANIVIGNVIAINNNSGAVTCSMTGKAGQVRWGTMGSTEYEVPGGTRDTVGNKDNYNYKLSFFACMKPNARAGEASGTGELRVIWP
ncbi:hypothetical protein M0J74_RS16460 [Providencia rettgeri]|nr:hypothetical protein [Providencia rettgeri]